MKYTFENLKTHQCIPSRPKLEFAGSASGEMLFADKEKELAPLPLDGTQKIFEQSPKV